MLIGLCLATLDNKWQQKLPSLPTVNLDYIQNNVTTTNEKQKTGTQRKRATHANPKETIIGINSFEEKEKT